MQTSIWRDPSSTQPRRRWLIGGVFVLLMLAAALVWLYRPRPVTDKAAKDEPRKPDAELSEARRVHWARGSRPPENPSIAATPTIRGVVLGADGANLAGVAVVAKDYQIAGNLPITVSSTKSDEQGRFELPVHEGAYYIHANKEGYGPTYVRATSGEAVSLILRKSGVLDGHVRDERGAPVTHFSIDVVFSMTQDRPALAPLWSGTFDSTDGSFRIAEMPSTSVVVRASAPGFAPGFSKHIRLAPGEQSSIDLTLSPGCTVEGTVADRSGKPLPEVFLDAEQGRTAGFRAEASLDATSQARSDAAGRFRLTNVPEGKIIVRAYDGAHAVTTAKLNITDCAEVKPVDIVMSLGGSIAGMVRADDGTPVAGAFLTATHRTIGFIHAVSDAEGRFLFDQMPPSTVPIEVLHEGRRAQVRVQAKEDQVVEQDITLPSAGTGVVRGRVTAGSRPLGGVVVEALKYADKKRTTLQTKTADDGSYQLSEVPAGVYMVRVPSASTRGRAQVKDDDVVTVDLEVAEMPKRKSGE